MQVTDELRVLVNAEVARAIENFKKFEGSVGGAEKKTRDLGNAIDSVSKKAMLISAAIGGAGIAAIKFAGENEKLKLSLKNMLGSAEEASAVFEEWRRLGNSPGLSANEVFELGQSMVNMGHDTAYATKTIQMLGNVAAGTGKSFGAVSGAFEHIRAAGKLTNRDLVSLQQQGIPILKQLAAELNTSEDGVRRLVSEGKIGFPDLEKAFRNMTEPGGQFAGMMEELSGTVLEKFSTAAGEAKQALASFGEMMLPMATELLGSATSMLRGITDMDAGTKRFVIGMGGVIAISGPAIAAIKGIGVALKAASANPYMLAIGGIIAAGGVVAGIINKQAHAYEDLNIQIRETDIAARDLLRSYADGNAEKTLDEKTTRKLIELYPDLTGVIKANNTTVKEAVDLQEALNKQRIIDAQASKITSLKKDQEELGRVLQAINELAEDMSSPGPGFSADQLNRMMEDNIGYRDSLIARIRRQQEEINDALSSVGQRYTLYGEFIDIPVTLTVDAEDIAVPSGPVIKKWQDWFGEIAKIDPALFGDSGAQAAELYLAEFSRSFEAGKTVLAALGEEFDVADALRSQQTDIQKTLIELFSINPADIDQGFTAIHEAIQPLIEDYRRLETAAKSAEELRKAAAAQKEYAEKIEGLRKKIGDFGKAESQLAYEAAVANGALSSQAEEIKSLMDEYCQTETVAKYTEQIEGLRKKIGDIGKSEGQLAYEAAVAGGALADQAEEIKSLINEHSRTEILAEYRRQIDEIGKSQRELAVAAFAATAATREELEEFEALYDKLAGLKEPAFDTHRYLEDIGDSLKNLGISSALNGIETLGRALGQGANAGESMRDALAAMSQEILNALPNMFLQAGLQLISQGQWPLGLGFVAAAGSTALIKGYVGGRIESEQSAARNAHGNAFGAAGVVPLAHGGSFTNQIVSQPTLFRFARGTGLMGEAGPEAIMPLKRMANGDLGIRSESGGAHVTVNIINNSGSDVRQEEHDDGSGNKQIDVIIGDLVNSHLGSGKADRVLGGRYGLRAAGV
jgi:tape measure domain-containing protein